MTEELFNKLEPLRLFVEAIPEIYLILDDKRQVVYANKAMYEFLKEKKEANIHGRMPGDLLNCRHAFENELGCGSTETCTTCGAFKAIVSSLEGKSAIEECRIEQNETGDALDFRVWTTPFQIDDVRYSILALTDISHEKRRQALESIFFHDILNTAGGLYGLAQLMLDADDESEDYKEIIFGLSGKLIDEINAQKMLSTAEDSTLETTATEINSIEFIEDIVKSFRKYYLLHNRNVQIDSSSMNFNFTSDKTLLRRVILNMLKNAIESAAQSNTVTIGCTVEIDKVEFWVHNPGEIPREIQLQIFKRSFSTKGRGRGLGTYSMKLLTERYLSGNITYDSTEELGTVFVVRLPRNFKELGLNE